MFDYTDFESGLNGWQFRSWMPNNRIANAEVLSDSGFLGTSGVHLYADGRDDDGIFYLEKVYRLSTDVTTIAVSWFFADFNPSTDINAWPRVVYVGPMKDLASPDLQHEFTWIMGTDNLVSLGDGRWNEHHVIQQIKRSTEFQVCVGWKINWETERVSYLDNLVVLAA